MEIIKKQFAVRGNETGMLTFLEAEGIKMNCTNSDVIDFGLSVASGKMKFDEILEWIYKFKR